MKMKKFWKVISLVAISGILSVSSVLAAENAYIVKTSDGTEIQFSDAMPEIKGEGIDEKLCIPLRKAAEALNATVYWFDSDRVIQVVGNDRMLKYGIDNNVMDVYSIQKAESGEVETAFVKTLTMPVAPYLKNDTTYVPLRATGDPLFASMDNIGNASDIEDLKNGEPDRAIQYAAGAEGSPATVTMPSVDIPVAEGLTRVEGTLRWQGGSWQLQEDSGKAWTIPSFPMDAATFWRQQLEGIEYPDGIQVTMTAVADGGNLPIKRMTTGIVMKRTQVTIAQEKDVPVSYHLKNNDKAVQDGDRIPVGATLYAKAEQGELADWKLQVNGETVDLAGGISVPKENITLSAAAAEGTVVIPECFKAIAKAKFGEPVTLTLNDGYYVENVKLNETTEVQMNQDGVYTFIMPEEEAAVTADWIKVTMDLAEPLNVMYGEGKITLTNLNNDLEYSINGTVENAKKRITGELYLEREVSKGETVTITAQEKQTASTEASVETQAETQAETPEAKPENSPKTEA